jgi:hypothetical protein
MQNRLFQRINQRLWLLKDKLFRHMLTQVRHQVIVARGDESFPFRARLDSPGVRPSDLVLDP